MLWALGETLRDYEESRFINKKFASRLKQKSRFIRYRLFLFSLKHIQKNSHIPHVSHPAPHCRVSIHICSIIATSWLSSRSLVNRSWSTCQINKRNYSQIIKYIENHDLKFKAWKNGLNLYFAFTMSLASKYLALSNSIGRQDLVVAKMETKPLTWWWLVPYILGYKMRG